MKILIILMSMLAILIKFNIAKTIIYKKKKLYIKNI